MDKLFWDNVLYSHPKLPRRARRFLGCKNFEQLFLRTVFTSVLPDNYAFYNGPEEYVFVTSIGNDFACWDTTSNVMSYRGELEMAMISAQNQINYYQEMIQEANV